ncbi:MAG: DUF2089 domain-containing protein [Pirellulales bacterium]|nr:DUF2089 domain-containing protein [Pirellulales bacterium]
MGNRPLRVIDVEQPATERWFDRLSDEDLAFVRRFILCSGSLKELASIYSISYPTVRLRLDRLIERIKLLESAEIRSEFERTARLLYADGKLDLASLKALLAAHRKEVEGTES